MSAEVAEHIKTPQPFVHVKHSISILQYKYWFLFLKVYKDRLDNHEIVTDDKGFCFIHTKDLMQWFGYEPAKKDIKQDLMELRNEPIVFNYLEKDGRPVTHGMGFISEWKIKGSRVGVKFPSLIIDVLEGDENAKDLFLLLNWNIFNSFTGKYEAIIYKLCRDYVGVGRTPNFSVEQWRQYIGLSDKEYQQFFRLNDWTITKPIVNINNSELSDIQVSVTYHRQGRKVIGLYFTVQYKHGHHKLQIENITGKQKPLQKTEKLTTDELAAKDNPLFQSIRVKLSPRKLKQSLDKYTHEQIASIIERANEYLDNATAQGKTIDNIAGVYYKALDEGWDADRIAKREQQRQDEDRRQAEIKAKKEAKRQAKLKADLEEAERLAAQKAEQDKALLIFESLAYDEQRNILEGILSQIPKIEKLIYKPKNDEFYYRKPPMLFKVVEFIKEQHATMFNV